MHEVCSGHMEVGFITRYGLCISRSNKWGWRRGKDIHFAGLLVQGCAYVSRQKARIYSFGTESGS